MAMTEEVRKRFESDMDHARVKEKMAGMMKSPKVKKAVKTLAVFFLALVLWIVLLEAFTADRYSASVKISQDAAQAAVSSDKGKIDYGTLAKGDAVERFINVGNSGNHKTEVRIMCLGNISNILKISENGFVLNPKEQKKVNLSLEVPKNTDRAAYSGTIIILKVPKIY